MVLRALLLNTLDRLLSEIGRSRLAQYVANVSNLLHFAKYSAVDQGNCLKSDQSNSKNHWNVGRNSGSGQNMQAKKSQRSLASGILITLVMPDHTAERIDIENAYCIKTDSSTPSGSERCVRSCA